MKVAYWATARIVGLVPATVFLPRPNVESALVDITRRPEPAVADVDRDRAVPPGAHRRSASAARCCAGRSPAWSAPEVFEAAGIDAERRPEELDVHEWGRARRLCRRRDRSRRRWAVRRRVTVGAGQADAARCASPGCAPTATT